jgi:hypothetical protein
MISDAVEMAGDTVSRDREAERVVGMVEFGGVGGSRMLLYCDRDDEAEFIRLVSSSFRDQVVHLLVVCVYAQKFERGKERGREPPKGDC